MSTGGFHISNQDFTMESWIWLDDDPWVWSTIISQQLDATTEQSFNFQYYDQQLRLRLNDSETTHVFSLTSANTPAASAQEYVQSVHDSYPTMSVSPSAWHHVTLVRSSGNITSYLDGAATDSVSDSTDIQYSDEDVHIGASNNGGTNFAVVEPFIGYMSNVKLTLEALYNDDFDPRVISTNDAAVLQGDPHVITFGGVKYTL